MLPSSPALSIKQLPDIYGLRAAKRDTRFERSPMLTGTATRGIAQRRRRRGYEVVASESFLVEDAERRT